MTKNCAVTNFGDECFGLLIGRHYLSAIIGRELLP